MTSVSKTIQTPTHWNSHFSVPEKNDGSQGTSQPHQELLMASPRDVKQPLRIAIMQPYLFPYIGYFQLINAVDKFVLLDNVNFIKRGWINRNRILVNGKEHLISVPLKKASQNQKIKDVRLVLDTSWQKKFLETIRHSYHRSPYFTKVYPLIEAVMSSAETHIAGLARESIAAINDYLGIPTKIIPTSSHYHNDELKAAHKILDICKKEGAKEYINPIGGIDLYDESFFRHEGITIHFLKPGNINYKHFNNNFIPNLSIIDVLMFNSVSAVQGLLSHYSMV